MASTRDKWDARYRDTSVGEAGASRVLVENTHLLPARGSALDLACGLGADALVLARHGLDTFAWDISAIAIDKLAARTRGLPLTAVVRDVARSPPEPERFDVIVVARFLERSLAPALAAALRAGGLLFYQTFITESVDNVGPANPAYRLAPNELRRLFDGLQLLVYREEGRVGDANRGFRNEAMLIARRAPSATDNSP